MLGAEVQHLLGLRYPADVRPREGAAALDQIEEFQFDGDLGRAQVHQGPFGPQQLQISAQRQRRRDRRDDEVEAPRQLVERLLVGGGVVVVGAQPQPVVLLLQGLAQHGDLGPQRVGDLHPHVPEAAETDDGDLLARSRLPVDERGVERDSGAEQRRRGGQRKVLGYPQGERFVDHDVGGVAAVGQLAVPVAVVVGADVAGAVLLLSRPAFVARAAGLDHDADADPVTGGEAGDGGAGRHHDARDLMAGDHRIGARAPAVRHLVDVGVADPRVLDLDQYIAVAQRTAGDGGAFERSLGGGRGIGADRAEVGDGHGPTLNDQRLPAQPRQAKTQHRVKNAAPRRERSTASRTQHRVKNAPALPASGTAPGRRLREGGTAPVPGSRWGNQWGIRRRSRPSTGPSPCSSRSGRCPGRWSCPGSS